MAKGTEKLEETIYDDKDVEFDEYTLTALDSIPLGIEKRSAFEKKFADQYIWQTTRGFEPFNDKKIEEHEELKNNLWKAYKRYNKEDSKTDVKIREDVLKTITLFLDSKEEFKKEYDRKSKIHGDKYVAVKTNMNPQVLRILWRKYNELMTQYYELVEKSKFRWYFIDDGVKGKFDEERNTLLEVLYILKLRGISPDFETEQIDDTSFFPDFEEMIAIIHAHKTIDIIRKRIKKE